MHDVVTEGNSQSFTIAARVHEEKEAGEVSPPPETAQGQSDPLNGIDVSNAVNWVKKRRKGGNMSLMTTEKRLVSSTQPS